MTEKPFVYPWTTSLEGQPDKAISGLPLKVNFAWTFTGNMIYSACQWGMLVVLAKLGNPEMVGQFTLGLAVCAPIFMLTNLQLRAVQATDAHHRYDFCHYLHLRLIMTGLALGLITAIVFLSSYNQETALVILIIGLAKAFESISDVFYGRLQQHERMDRIALSMTFKGLLSLLALSIFIYLTRSIVWAATGLTIAWALILLSYDIRSGSMIASKTKPDTAAATIRLEQVGSLRKEVETIYKLAWLALPLGIVMMLISLNANIPRYFVELYLGEYNLGIFAALSYIILAGNAIILALGQSASPRLAKYYAEGNGAKFSTLLVRLVGVAILLGGAGLMLVLFAGQTILTLIYGAEYAEHQAVFCWLTVAATISFVASFLGYGMTAAQRFSAQIPLFILVAGTTALLCLLLIPIQGLQGAALSMIVAAFIQMIGSLAIVIDALNHSPAKRSPHSNEP